MILLRGDSVECLARRGKSASRTPVALCVTVFRCFVKRSLGSSSRPKYLILFCIRQTDLKPLIAYSSVVHISMVIGGIMTLSYWGGL
jgi:hypothetical protein